MARNGYLILDSHVKGSRTGDEHDKLDAHGLEALESQRSTRRLGTAAARSFTHKIMLTARA